MSSPVIPLDPVDVEQLPPEDLAACDHCGGTGAVWDGWDPQTAEACPRCGGEGVLPDLGVAS